jgi:hypothetical protein
MAAKKFKVKYEGIDGNSVSSFSSLAAAGKYLSERYQGAEYLSGMDVMGTDYAQYVLVGFTLGDVGKFEYCDGYRDFQFYDWAGGKLVEIKKFTVVTQDDSEYAEERVVASFDDLAAAIAKAIELCSDYRQFGIKEGKKSLGYAFNKQWYDNSAVEQVVVQNESPAPF